MRGAEDVDPDSLLIASERSATPQVALMADWRGRFA
jgi:hypothetical protein